MKHFYSPKTQFNPEYRNVQSELWQLLTDEQQKIVAQLFCHLKNHAQIEIAEALIDYIEADVRPEVSDWSDTNIGSMFYVLVFRLFGKDLTMVEGSGMRVEGSSQPKSITSKLKYFFGKSLNPQL